MKKLYYFLLLVLCLPYFAFSQQLPKNDLVDNVSSEKVVNTSNNVSGQKSGSTFWEEDFANGFPSDWATEDLSGICPWKWSLNGSHGFFNNTQATDYADPIQSTTGSNGFLIADNDSSNQFNYGQPSGANYQYLETYFITSAIDLTGHDNVMLEFEHTFRFNNDLDLMVMVSSDSINWTEWKVQGNATNNTASADPELAQVNISCVAGGQSSVYIKIGWNARVYYWMIDDMRIVEGAENDMILSDMFYNEWFADQAVDRSTLEYSIYPSTQLRPLNFKTIFYNDGPADQTNVTMTADVLDPSNANVFTGSSTLPNSMTCYDIDSLYVAGYTPSGTLGRHNVEYSITQDQVDDVPSNNVGTNWFEVSDYTFAQDTGALDGTYFRDEAYEIGNWFYIENTGDQLYGIDVALGDETTVGTLIYGVLYDFEQAYLDETFEYTVTASDLNGTGGNNFVTLVFNDPVPLNAGEDYLVMAAHYGGDTVEVGLSGNSPQSASQTYRGGTWYYITNTPMVRMNLNPSVGINDEIINTGIRLEQNHPNPFAVNTRLIYEVDRPLNVVFEVHDLTGKLVKVMDLGKVSAGKYSLDLNADDFDSGVYFYSLSGDNVTLTKRMMILGK